MKPPAPVPLEDEAWEPPKTFEEYEILRPLGRGRTGRVYLARDTLLERLVAVKFIRAPSEEDLERFIVEARAAARVQHPNVVSLYRVGQLDDRMFLVSEYVRGVGLERLRRPISWEQAAEIGLDLARGLAAAHHAGVLHRDLKPANAVLAESGEVKLLDFGVAELIDPDSLVDAAAAPSAESMPSGGAKDLSLPPGRTADPAVHSLPPPILTGGSDQRVGTPYFMAPEAWRGETLGPRTDLFSLGVVLYELMAGAGPYRRVPFDKLPEYVQQHDARPLREAAPDVPPALAAIVDRCLARDPAQRFASADALLDALEAALTPAEATAIPAGNPYRGLQAFEPEHRALFFGRKRDVRTVVERLRGASFVLLTGDSGVGKSSLCLAGVIPAVLEGGLSDRRTWRMVRSIPGRRPVLSLAAALAPVLGVDEDALIAGIQHEPSRVVRALREGLGEDKGLLVYLDQLEELVTLSLPEEAAQVAEVLAQIGGGVLGCRLLASARSDFLTRLGGLPALGELLTPALYLVRPLGPREVREVIVGPAQAGGVSFESEALITTLVTSTLRTESGLPLLQFALAELWEARDEEAGVIRAQSLEALGGVDGALARYADGVVGQLLPAHQRAARQVLMRLVTLDGTRARRTKEELVAAAPDAAVALEALIRARLVVAQQMEAGVSYDLAHEALLRGWGTLATWLEETRELRQVQARIERAAHDWDLAGRPRDLLWRGEALSTLAPSALEGIAPTEQAFLAASRRANTRSRMLARVAVVGVLAALALTYAGVKLRAFWVLQQQVEAQLADSEAALEDARDEVPHLLSDREGALADFDAGRTDAGNTRWQKALAQREQVEKAYDRASAALERALVLDPSRSGLRARFAGVLAERAALDERILRYPDRDALLARLSLYDDGGPAAHGWAPTVKLHLRTQPEGATVTVAQYVRDAAGHQTLGPARPVGKTPVDDLDLPRGSYLFHYAAPGRAGVDDPLRVEGRTPIERTVPLPEAAKVPADFAFVAAGDFLYGSGADDSIRQFFNTVPLHPVHTDSYLIGRHEVTFAEYAAFLDTLPKDERAKRSPRPSVAPVGSVKPQVALTASGPGRWRLQLTPGEETLEADWGDPVQYAGRSVHARQDWRRFPVGGIDFEDAIAYARWLDQSGRLPGARLCTETEWERGARGADGREFPEGDTLGPKDANFDETYGKVGRNFGPDEVGLHPASRSPYGLDDMAGNVFEWTRSATSPDQPVARGGSYLFAATTCRSTNRETPEPRFRDLSVGFRVCATIH